MMMKADLTDRPKDGRMHHSGRVSRGNIFLFKYHKAISACTTFGEKQSIYDQEEK
jgi:hypothetical protein